MCRALSLVAACALLTAIPTSGAFGQATPYVPDLDFAYRDLDVLVASGLVRDVLVGEKPLSRAAFGRIAAEAAERAEQRDHPLQPRTREALDRLTRRFGAGGEEVGRDDLGWVRPRAASVEMSAADSPARALRSGADGSIDGVADPLLQLNEGRQLADGYTWAAEGRLDLQWRFLAGQLAPRVWADAPRGPANVGADATFVDAYVRSVVGPFGLDLGRGHAILGYGRDGGPMLSDNARGLDMVRLTMDRPIRLPGFLRVLGLWKATGLVADMGNNQDQPGSMLVVLRLSGRPSRYVEFGINYLNHQGGEGAPNASLRERLHDIFFFWTDGGVLQISDKVAGADLGFTVPALRTRLFVNFLTTDDRGRFSQPAGGYWEDAIWSAGTRVYGLGPEGRYDVWGEWRHAGPRAHTHGQLTSGLTLDGRVIGDFMGPNAAGVQVGVDRNGPRSVLSLTGAWERYSGDDYEWHLIPGGDPWDFDWFKIADNPDEIRKRVTLDWFRPAESHGVQTTVRVGYEHVTRYAFTTSDRSNFLAQLRVGYTW